MNNTSGTREKEVLYEMFDGSSILPNVLHFLYKSQPVSIRISNIKLLAVGHRS